MRLAERLQNDYVRDQLGRLKQLTQQAQEGAGANIVAEKRVDFSYNLTSQFDTITRYNTLAGDSGDLVATSTYGYDGAGRLDALAHDLAAVGTPEIQYGFEYDVANRLESFTNSAHPTENVDLYSYDAKDQLIDVDYEDSGTDDETYVYDPNGNRESVTIGASTDTYTPGSNNQLGSDGTYDYEYDFEGNLISKTDNDDESTSYLYDQRNRLTKATITDAEGTRAVDYLYDPFDRLVRRRFDTTAPYTFTDGETEYFVYDGSDVALAFDGAGSLTTRYLNGPAVDQILAEETIDGGETQDVLYMLPDHQGSIRDVIDESGAVQDHIFYDAYGNPTGDDPNVQNTYGYAGYFYDPVTGFNITPGRIYKPSLGRWMQEDPIPDDVNPYRYGRNSPTNLIDPDGLTPISTTTPEEAPIYTGGPDAPPLATPFPEPSTYSDEDPLAPYSLGAPTPRRMDVEELGDGLRRYTFDDGTVIEEFRDSKLGSLRLRITDPDGYRHVETREGIECYFNSRHGFWEAEGSFTPEERSSFSLMLEGGAYISGFGGLVWIRRAYQFRRLTQEAKRRPYQGQPGEEINPGQVNVYRGGESFELKAGEYKVDSEGLVRSTHGVSLDTDSCFPVVANLGPRRVVSIPKELKIIQRSKRGTHFEIVPREPMTVARYQELLRQIVTEAL